MKVPDLRRVLHGFVDEMAAPSMHQHCLDTMEKLIDIPPHAHIVHLHPLSNSPCPGTKPEKDNEIESSKDQNGS